MSNCVELEDCNLQCSEIYRGILGDGNEHKLLTYHRCYSS